MATRVVVTGLGAVTPVGDDVEQTWAALINGKSGVARITLFDPSPFSVQIAGEVKGFDPTNYIEPKEARRMDRCVQFAVVATQEALKDAGLTIDPSNSENIGVIIGTAVGGIRTLLEQQKVLEERGPTRVSPFFLPMMIPDTPAGQVAISMGIKGPNLAVVSACATGGNAIGEATELIKRGDADVVVTGGTDAALVPLVLAGFIVMRALAADNDAPETASRPFDLTRSGFVMSEGATILILERLEHARAREARIYAEVIGYGSTADAYHLAAPAERGEGAARAMQMALRKAGIRPEEVDYINAHGTSTPLNDKLETVAIKTIFGEHAYRLAVSSTKSMVGHMMGAAGAVEGMACVLAIRDQIIPPTMNYRNPDPECDLDYVPNVARPAKINVALSNSMGLGGHNSCVIFRKFE
ncbi:MAG: beta-ketoacyl-ACP synthase II [Chloroflexi bacterium]|nr:beta-ketoacyl-ACP synthase II [Chloroflexota bacterium]MCL5074824.1 beta-ketoacyl-ACP synthase II [Chloroflexota bacterium]